MGCDYGELTIAAYNVNKFLNTKGNFNVTSVDFLREKNEQGYNVNASVSVKNPSPFTVDVVRFHISSSYLKYGRNS